MQPCLYAQQVLGQNFKQLGLRTRKPQRKIGIVYSVPWAITEKGGLETVEHPSLKYQRAAKLLTSSIKDIINFLRFHRK